jgi:two-component sensor histidine kinase/PAS domain-containing protein
LPYPTGNPPDPQTFGPSNETGLLVAAILSTLQEAVLILGSDLRVEAANPTFCDRFRLDAQHTRGCKIYDLGNREWNIPELRNLLDRVLETGEAVTAYRLDHEFAQLGRRVLVVNARRLDRQSGGPLIVLALHDDTDGEFAHEYSEKIIDALRDPFLILDWDLRVKTANGPFYKKFRVEPSETEGRFIYELGNGQWDIPRLRELLEKILPRESTFDDFEVEHDFEDLGHRVMLLNARRVDAMALILLVIEDVTEQKRAAAQQTLLLGELQHRVKNLLMSVRALAHLTQQGASSLEAFAQAFDGRIDAMARTQDLLVRGPADNARLDEIIGLELAAIGGRKGSSFALHGPELRLSARASHAFAMTELATNAAKYGALSSRAANGCVDVEWSVGAAEPGRVHLHFSWREHGVPGVSPGATGSRGFGTQIIENSVPHLFGGWSTLGLNPGGAECTIDVAIPSEELASGRKNRV